MYIKLFRLYFLAFAALLLISGSSCEPSKTWEPEHPMFWTWWNYRPSRDRPVNLDSVFRVMKETGLDGVILNARSAADYRRAIPVAHANGLKVWAWWWALNLEHDRDSIMRLHPDWFQVNRLGTSLYDAPAYVQYYRFLDPSNPEVRAYKTGRFAELAAIDGLDGIVIDYCRFPDVILPTTLWSRYGVVQDREYAEFDYGYNPGLIQQFMEAHPALGDPRDWEDPTEGERGEIWLYFRAAQVTGLVNEYAAIARQHGIVMSASPFPTPAMSRRMVRQSWDKWELDVAFPMIYKNFYTGCVSFIADCTIESVRTAHPMTTVMAGITGFNGPEMFASMDAALNNGAQGIAIFTIGSLRTPEVRAQFRAYTDSVRETRAKHRGVNPALVTDVTVDTDGFNKPVIMGFVENRMAHYIGIGKAVAANNLDWATVDALTKNPIQAFTTDDFLNRMRAIANRTPEWQPLVNSIEKNLPRAIKTGAPRLERAWRTTRYYHVTEENSGVIFKVDFYLYGDLVSGWDVAPEPESFNAFIQKNR